MYEYNRVNPKPRSQLSVNPTSRNDFISFCRLILIFFISIIQVSPPVKAQSWIDAMPTPQEFKTDMEEVWEPIQNQYVPYGIGLMALGLLLRKI